MKKYLSIALAFSMMFSTAVLVSCDSDPIVITVGSGNRSTSETTHGVPAVGIPADGTISAGSADSTVPSTDVGSGDPLWDALMALYRPYTDAVVEDADAFKADAKNQNLMDEYFNFFNFALSYYGGFEYSDGYLEYGYEDPPNLFDNDVNTKWVTSAPDHEFANAIVWSMTDIVNVTGYSLTSGNDNSVYTERNPITWRLYGTNEFPSVAMTDNNEALGNTYFETYTVPEGWNLIDAIDAVDPKSDGRTSLIPDLDFNETVIRLSAECQYQYFMFLIDTNENNCIQLSEITLYGTPVEG